MKILFVYPKFIEKATGGIQCSKRNSKSLVHIFGKNNVILYPVERKGSRYSLKKVINLFTELGLGGLDRNDKEKIVKILNSEHVDIVHLDTSLYGSLAKYIRAYKKDVSIVTFFHNVEYDFTKSFCSYTSLHGLLMGCLTPLVRRAEKYSVRYSNLIISLHNKDSERLRELYGKSADYEIPITLNDSNAIIDTKLSYGNKLRLLFFGSKFKPNIEAIDILLNKIWPLINVPVELLIAGDRMDSLVGKYKGYDNIRIKGYVEDLDDMYNWADVVVLPIFSGAGMKVKTAEAMLYGKNILASDMALEGYDVENVPGIVRCHTIDDFVKGINAWNKSLPRYNLFARKIYEHCYSYDASFSMFEKAYGSLVK